MPRRYQEIYPSPPLMDSDMPGRPSATSLMRVEYFQAEAATMPEDVFADHHVLLNLKATPQRVQNWRDGVLHDFTYHLHEVVVTPAGMRSGWRWFETSDVIVVTLDPKPVEKFAEAELGILLSQQQLADLKVFHDPDLCIAGTMLRDTLQTDDLASGVMFESLARVFLIKLLQRYGQTLEEEVDTSAKFTTQHFRRVLEYIKTHIGKTIVLDELAREAGMSASHFSRQFKDTVGKSPMQYVLAYRVEQSAKMMADPNVPLIEVALTNGFADQAHFSRSFKQLMGQTPRAYRASLAA